METSLHFFMENWKARRKFYDSLRHYDLFFIHRRLFSPAELWYIRRRAKKIVFDFDDAIMYRSSSAKHPHSLSRRIKFAYMTRRVDFVIAGNEFLKSEVLPYTSKVEVIPTSIDLSQYGSKEPVNHRGPLTIGWLGSSSTLKYLERLMPTFESLYQRYPHFQLKIVCDQFLEGGRVPVVKKKWSAQEEEADLRSFDIGLMPLTDDLWSRGKCGLKILQYYTVEVPVVCTPVGVNREIVEDGVNGFWAQSEEEWTRSILKLMQDDNLRREMGLKGRKTVEKSYSLEINAPRLLNVLKKVAQG